MGLKQGAKRGAMGLKQGAKRGAMGLKQGAAFCYTRTLSSITVAFNSCTCVYLHVCTLLYSYVLHFVYSVCVCTMYTCTYTCILDMCILAIDV